MKILHINSYYSTSHFYKNLYEYQVKCGFDIDVFVPVSSSFQRRDFDYGDYTTISSDHSRFDRLVFHLKHRKILKDIQSKYKVNNYTLIHAHSLFSNGYIALRLKKKFGIPYIVAVRNTDVNVFFKKMIHLRKLGIEILNEANHIVFLSETYKNHLIDTYVPNKLRDKIQNKISIIPNGIDDFWFDKIDIVREDKEFSKLKLLQVGDVNKNKNVETTIKAMEILRRNSTINAELNVVGRVKDKKIFKKYKDKDYVHFLGFKTRDELIDIYRESDIFILPSIKETFGLVYAEAMSQGLPILYTKGQGFDGQFRDGLVGFSIDSLNKTDIANKIRLICKNYKSLSYSCINNCLMFRWNSIGASYTDIYLLCIGKR